MNYAQKKNQAKAQRKAARFLRALYHPMKDREVRICVSLPFQRATPDLRNLIRDHLERLHVALLAEGHEVEAVVHEVRRVNDTVDAIHAEWSV